jgi:hypothetical protein
MIPCNSALESVSHHTRQCAHLIERISMAHSGQRHAEKREKLIPKKENESTIYGRCRRICGLLELLSYGQSRISSPSPSVYRMVNTSDRTHGFMLTKGLSYDHSRKKSATSKSSSKLHDGRMLNVCGYWTTVNANRYSRCTFF